MSGDRLVEEGATRDTDLTNEIVGLSFTNLGSGRNKIMLRGLSDGALTGRAQSLVGLYLDDTRITYGAPDPDIKLVDIKSVEVLRGPQGALYGAGAIAGIMRVETNPVDLNDQSASLTLAAETTRGGDPGANIDVVYNVPIIAGAFAVRGALYDQQTAGWLDNAGTGVANANAVRRTGGRLATLAKIGTDWTLAASLIDQEITTEDSQYSTLTGGVPQRRSAMAEPNDNDFSMTNLTLRGDLDWAAFASSTSLVRHRISSRFDATGSFSDFVASAGAASPIDEQSHLSVIVNETRLTSPTDDPSPWVVGLFYADGDNKRSVQLREGAPDVWDHLAYTEDRVDKIDEIAIFGQQTFRLTPALSLNVGARLFRSTMSVQSVVQQRGRAAGGPVSGHLADAGVAPDVRLSFQPNPDLLLYVSAARGYRAGGFNTGEPAQSPISTTVQPFRRYSGDKIWTYEIGAQAYLFDNRLALQATLFDSDWHDLQTDTLLSHGFPYSGNVGDARVSGVEALATYRPMDSLQLTLNAMINEPEIKRVDPSFPQATNGGLPGSPEYTVGGSAHYDWHISMHAFDVRAFFEARATYIGGSTLGFGAGQAIGDYFDVDAKLGFALRNWQALLYIDNLSGAEGETYSFGNPYRPDDHFVTLQRPRTIGVSLRREF